MGPANSLEMSCKLDPEYVSLVKVIVAVLNLVACLAFYIYSASYELNGVHYRWIAWKSYSVPGDPCDGIRVFESEIKYDEGLYAVFYTVYGLLEILTALFMACSLKDTNKKFHPVYTIWLTLQLTLLTFLILHGTLLLLNNQMFAQAVSDHCWALVWKLTVLGIFNPFHHFEDKEKAQEGNPGSEKEQASDSEGPSPKGDDQEEKSKPKHEDSSSAKTDPEVNPTNDNNNSEGEAKSDSSPVYNSSQADKPEVTPEDPPSTTSPENPNCDTNNCSNAEESPV